MKTFAIFGPPGTGKTTTTLSRMSILRDRGMKPEHIGFFSFTRAAAQEALKRLGVTRSDKVSTLHAFMFRRFNLSTQSVVDSWKLKKFGDQIGMPFSGASNDLFEQMEIGDQFLALWGLARARLRNPVAEYHASSRPGTLSQFQFFIESYNSWKKALGLIDYTDMLEMYLAAPFNHGAEALFIDESQDLSPLQWAVIDRMLDPEINPQLKFATIAGDDDQAIYEWAGADPHGMASFCERYDARVDTLAQSYRVPAKAHELAHDIIGLVKKRVDKVYQPRDHVGVVVREPEFDHRVIRPGVSTMVLCRSFVARQNIEDHLVAKRIPYRTEGGRPGLYHTRFADALRALDTLASGGTIGTNEFDSIRKLASPQAARFINERDLSGLFAFCKGDRTKAIKIPGSMVEFYRDADLTAKPDITLSTIHASKGREADDVILHSGITKRTADDMETNPDAEARVWYVAVTRTRERLVVLDSEMAYPHV